MIQPATILIADISGFTNFVSSTELEHSSHIINELLELIVEANTLGLTVSEIEGDAVLFYKTGEAIACDDMVAQCIDMFERFHGHLKSIQRDTICQCGTCQGVSSLGLKFIAHFGEIREIKVANFTKGSGLDMIIAHRLLKNEVQSNEYVLVTDAYRQHLDCNLGSDLAWFESSESYPDIGPISLHYALLKDIRSRIADPPRRPDVVIPVGDDALKLEIEVPLINVYMRLIDIEKKREWVVGLDGIDVESDLPRAGQRHTCLFSGMTLDFELLRGELLAGRAIYSEKAEIRGMPFGAHQQTYTLTALDSERTEMLWEVAWGDPPTPPDDMKQMYVGGCLASFETLKGQLEA